MANRSIRYSILVALAAVAVPMVASAGTAITVLTVPWIASGALPYHYSWDGKQITLKGVTNVQDTGTKTILYDWNPGDGGTHCTGVVTNMGDVECQYTYTYAKGATVGNTFGATLTVYDCSTGTGVASPCNTAPYSNSASAVYNTTIYAGPAITAGNPVAAAPNLPVEVNAAIDAGLWNLHKTRSLVGGAVSALTLTGHGQNYALEFNGTATAVPATDCYYSAVAVTITGAGGTGSGAVVTATVDTQAGGSTCDPGARSATYGQITGLTIVSGGADYVAPLTITFADDYCPDKAAPYIVQTCGSGATATGTVSAITAGSYSGYWSGNSPVGITATNCQAFEVSGHLESGPASDPYTADVKGCLGAVFSVLQTSSVSGTKTNTHGSYTTDQNGNGIGVHEVDGQGEDQYQGGMMLDAITASGTPNKIVTVGPLASLGHPPSGLAGTYTYGDAVADIADYIAYCQTEEGTTTTQGSWLYSCNSGLDNSVAQWNAIGLLSAVRDFDKTVPADTLLANQDWITTSQEPGFGGNGYFGYRSNSPLWGPYAVTPSGMVQMALNGIGRSKTATCCTAATNGTASQFDWAETFIRDNFDTAQTGNALNDVKDYFYGLYSTTKSMILHDNTKQGGGQSPIQFMRSLDNAAKPLIDWYAAQTAAYGGSDTSNGIARTLISGTPANGVPGQNVDGSWFAGTSSGHDYTSAQYPFETGWAIIMLNRTVTALPPTACGTSPSGTNDTSIQLNGSCSTDANPNATITTWAWDVSCTGGTNYTVFTVKPFYTFNVNPNLLPYTCPVTLQVTDSVGLTATTTVDVFLSAAAGDAAPVANAGGPYNFCTNLPPWLLDASLSTNPGVDVITGYGWNFTSNCTTNTYTDSTLEFPRVDVGTPNMFSDAPGSYCVKVQVTNNKGFTNVASGIVTIGTITSPNCSNCVAQPTAKPTNVTPGKNGTVQVYWIDTNHNGGPAVDHYDVVRSTDNFVTQIEIAGPNGKYPSIPAGAGGEQLSFIDGSITVAQTYYYRVLPATTNDTGTCSSPITVVAKVGAGR